MKRFLIFLALCSIPTHLATAQHPLLDSLKRKLAQTRPDSNRVLLLAEIAFHSQFYTPEATEKWAQQALSLARKLNYKKGEGRALMAMGIPPRFRGDLLKSLEYTLQSLRIAQAVQDRKQEALTFGALATIYNAVDDLPQAINFQKQSLRIYEILADTAEIARKRSEVAMNYTSLKELDSARFFNQQAESLARRIQNPQPLLRVLANYGLIADQEGNTPKALSFYRQALELANQHNNSLMQTANQHYMATSFKQTGQIDSSLHYAQLAYSNSLTKHPVFIKSSSLLLAQLYESRNQVDSAYKYLKLNKAAVDSLFLPKKLQNLQQLAMAEQQRQQALIAAQKDYQNQVRLYTVLAVLLVFLLIALILYRNNRQKQKANDVLQQTLAQLKATQAQLIKKEKLVALQAQMNPHFVFNCLNSIKYFILKNDAGQASDFLSKFARLIRLVLDNSRSERVALGSELEALRLYIELESMRFDDKVHHRIEVYGEIDPDDVRIPPLLLQPFVENAIWHGLMPKPEGGTIRITVNKPHEEQLHIEISDDGIGRSRATELKSKTSGKHQSFAVQATAERVRMINQLYNVQTQVEMVDLVDSFGEVAGTKVMLDIPV